MGCTLGLIGLLAVLGADETAREVARWSFESLEASETDPADRTAKARPVGKAKRTLDEDVPGPFVYDPLSQRSRTNRSSALFVGGERSSQAWAAAVDFKKLAGKSVTLEAFVRPDKNVGGNAWLVGKSRGKGPMVGAELALQLFELRNANQTWHGFEVSAAGAQPIRSALGHYSSSTRIGSDNDVWRHVAVVYDADAKSVTGWVDYHLARKVALEKPLVWDNGPFLIGGRTDHWGMTGKLDEVRLCDGALGPQQFLRVRKDAIERVSFRSQQEFAPRDAGLLDVKENFGAVGDGKTDDTAAFNLAFASLASRVPLAYSTLLIPPGEYLLTGRLHCSRFIDVKGAGPEKTILRLKDGTFTDVKSPEPVLRMSSTSGPPGSNQGVNGSSISIYLDGVTIDTGRNNPAAKALEFHANNVGRLENVVLRSGDGAGLIGLDLNHHDVGPALVKKVRIEGFDVGVAIRYQEYSMTFEHLTLVKQNVVGIRNVGNILAIRKLHSENAVPAIEGVGANSMITLLDSSLIGGASDQPAIQTEGALYALRVATQGYRSAIKKRILVRQNPVEWRDVTVAGPNLEEYIGDRMVKGYGAPTGALKLPIEETPDPKLPPVSEWVNVAKFVDRKVGADWSPVLQAAIDSGAKVVYLPHELRMEFHSPVRLHSPVERLMGFGGELNWAGKAGRKGKADNGEIEPVVIFDEPDPSKVIVIDRLGCQSLQHHSPATLVLRSSSLGRYTTGREGGRLFAEDIGGADWHFNHPQKVWVRQWNPESHEAGPCIESKGATIWALGFKTEYESQKLRATAGAHTEILGGFIYPIGKIPAERPIFENYDSRMALVYGVSVYHSNHKVHIRDGHGADRKETGNDQLNWAGSRSRMDLYTSDATKSP